MGCQEGVQNPLHAPDHCFNTFYKEAAEAGAHRKEECRNRPLITAFLLPHERSHSATSYGVPGWVWSSRGAKLGLSSWIDPSMGGVQCLLGSVQSSIGRLV